MDVQHTMIYPIVERWELCILIHNQLFALTKDKSNDNFDYIGNTTAITEDSETIQLIKNETSISNKMVEIDNE